MEIFLNRKRTKQIAPRNPFFLHRHHDQYREDLPFWESLAANARGKILELGCGAGRVLLPLASTGYSLVGMDWDLGALSFLAGRIAAADLPRVEVLAGDFRAPPLTGQFPLVIMPCNTLSTVVPGDHAGMLEAIGRLLPAGGVFAASVPNPVLLEGLQAEGEVEVEHVVRDPAGQEGLQVSSTWERRGKVVTIRWFYDALKTDGRVERSEAWSTHHIVSREQWHRTFQENGFVVEVEYGDFDRTPYHADSPHWIFGARVF